MSASSTRSRSSAGTRRIRPKRSYGARLTQPARPVRHRPPTHIVVGVILLVVAAALVPTHLAEHAGVLDPLPGKLEDLLLGFPMAGILGISGFIALIWR